MSVVVDGVTYDVDPSVVSDAASFCSNTATEVSAQLTNLQNFCDQMTEYWSGPAADQFQRLMTEYQTAASGIELALNQISEGLNSTSMNYTTAEEAAVLAAQQITAAANLS